MSTSTRTQQHYRAHCHRSSPKLITVLLAEDHTLLREGLIKTVEKHRGHLTQKLDIHDTATLTRYAITEGIIESSVQ